MPRLSITRSAVDAIGQTRRTLIYYDCELKGFGVRVTPSGHKSWIVEYRPNGGGRGVSSRRMTLGSIAIVTLDEARKSARSILAKALLGGDPAGDREQNRDMPTVKEFSERFMADYAEEHLKPSTQATYRSHFERLINPHIGSLKINNVTKADVRAMHRAIARTGRDGRRREPIANRALVTFSSMWTFAVAEGVIGEVSNPARAVEDYAESFYPHYLTTKELEKVGAALAEAETVGIPSSTIRSTARHCYVQDCRTFLDPHAIAGIRLLLLTGMRKGELLNLKWTQVDFERGLLLLPDSKTREKTIVLNSYAIAVLADIPVCGPYVIAGADPSKPRADLRREWRTILCRAGIAHARLHDCRHTHASVGVSEGIGLVIIGKLLGHKTTKTTERYAHLEKDPLLKGSERIGGVLAAALSAHRTQHV